jgi:uncharacterized alpha-E superfamily protein
MLSRTAENMFWMGRYMERAENAARLLGVGLHLELDLHGLLAGPEAWQWSSLLTILGLTAPEAAGLGESLSGFYTTWLTVDPDNSQSVMACVNRARNNARSIRGSLNPEVWRELNKLYWQLKDPEFIRQVKDAPHEFCTVVEAGSHAFQGVCDATLMHDEGWQFLQLGKHLERSDRTLRILDVKYHLIQDMADPANQSLSNLQWAGVLKSCLAYESYQRLYISRVEPDRVVEYLLLHPSFPRSVRYCLEETSRALEAIEAVGPRDRETKADRLLGRLLSDLRFVDLNQVLTEDLHGFLENLMARCNQVSQMIQEHYAFY